VNLRLKSQRFREEREAEWKRLEDILARVERWSPSVLTDDEMIALPLLYRTALSSLSVARAISLDHSLIRYLESLCARAYFFVYGPRVTFRERVRRFFAHDWPDAVRALWCETLISAGLMLLGIAIAWSMVSADPSWYYSFIPAEMAQGRDPGASVETLRETLVGETTAEGLAIFATFLFTHNSQIAIMSFALGFALGMPTLVLMIYNGLSIGAFLSVFAERGLTYEVGGWLLIHGTTELFAVVLAGAAGFHIGWTLAFPGNRTRADALAAAGKRGTTVMVGAVVMLACAGLLEGFGRQLVEQTELRYLIAAGTAVIWGFYFYYPGWREADHERN
jgi:uncharacterized membrane protein SpoIIM required for sporulation